MPRRFAFVAPIVACLASCLQVTTASTSPADSGAGAPAPAAQIAAADGGPMGAGCSEDQATQVVLCQSVVACPGVVVDPEAFPDCGFRVRAGAGLDLECLCSGALCPVGVPTTCDQAAALLAAQTSSLLVCAQHAEGRCVETTAPAATAPSSCDRACQSQCAGDPSCFQLCGC
jgi:hypothetical protein